MTTEAFTAIPPMQDPIEPSNGTGESAPRRGRKERAPRRAGAVRRPRSLRQPIAATLMTLNLALMVIPPLSRDQMDPIEIDALARALDEQAKQSPRFRKMLEGALSVTSGGQLLGVLAIMGARRAARHHLIPIEADDTLGRMLAMSLDVAPPVMPEEPEPVAPGA